MTDKIYDSKDEAMEAAKGVQALSVIRLNLECYADNIELKLPSWASDRDVVFRFKFKPSPKAGTRGHAWNGSGPRPANAPIYTATGEVDYKGKVFVTNINGGKMSVDHFEPIEPDTDLETAVGRIVTTFSRYNSLGCYKINCNECPAKAGSETSCKEQQIANLLRIGRGEG